MKSSRGFDGDVPPLSLRRGSRQISDGHQANGNLSAHQSKPADKVSLCLEIEKLERQQSKAYVRPAMIGRNADREGWRAFSGYASHARMRRSSLTKRLLLQIQAKCLRCPQAMGSWLTNGMVSQRLPAATMQLLPDGVVLTTVQVCLLSEV